MPAVQHPGWAWHYSLHGALRSVFLEHTHTHTLLQTQQVRNSVRTYFRYSRLSSAIQQCWTTHGTSLEESPQQFTHSFVAIERSFRRVQRVGVSNFQTHGFSASGLGFVGTERHAALPIVTRNPVVTTLKLQLRITHIPCLARCARGDAESSEVEAPRNVRELLCCHMRKDPISVKKRLSTSISTNTGGQRQLLASHFSAPCRNCVCRACSGEATTWQVEDCICVRHAF